MKLKILECALAVLYSVQAVISDSWFELGCNILCAICWYYVAVRASEGREA